MKPKRVVGRHDGIIVQGGVKAMGLIICLVQQIDAVLIAKLIPAIKESIVCHKMRSRDLTLTLTLLG